MFATWLKVLLSSISQCEILSTLFIPDELLEIELCQHSENHNKPFKTHFGLENYISHCCIYYRDNQREATIRLVVKKWDYWPPWRDSEEQGRL